MLNAIRQFLPFIFLAITLTIAAYAFLFPKVGQSSSQLKGEVGAKKKAQDSFFSIVNYYNLKNQLPFLHLDSSELNISGSSRDILFLKPKGQTFTKDRKPVNYIAEKGFFKSDSETLFLEGSVDLESSESKIQSESMVYKLSIEMIIAKREVHSKTHSLKTGEDILINADEMESYLGKEKATYRGNVSGYIKRRRVYEQAISFKSDKLYLDLSTSLVEMDGNVTIQKQGVTAKSHRGEIFLENYNKNLKYYVLYDDVRLTEKLKSPTGTIFERRAFAEKLEGVMSEDKIILTGYPKVFQGQDVIKGNRIILRENNEIVEVDDANSNFELK